MGWSGPLPSPGKPIQAGATTEAGALPEGGYRVVSPGGFVFGVSGAEAPEPRAEEIDTRGAGIADSMTSGRSTGSPLDGPGGEGGDRAPWQDETVARSAAVSGGEEGEMVYIPPESDIPPSFVASSSTPAERPPAVPPEPALSDERTQAIEPVRETGRVRVPQVTCPECYAPNPEVNRFCQECGSPLSLTARGGAAAKRPVPAGADYRPTAALHLPEEDVEAVGYTPDRGREVRAERKFGAADALAIGAAILLAASLALPSLLGGFSYKKGVDLGVFSHQGAYVRGAYELLGGPGLLPYRGVEFFTVGLVLAVALLLTLLFLALRLGRGPMFILAGCLVALPLVYLFFQALLPLREMGVEIEPALGLGRLFFGGDGAPGLGPTVWMSCAAALLLVMAGFLAPPRGWGRFFTFLVFFSLALGAGFLCAACYNWNLFISGTSAGSSGVPAPLGMLVP